MVTLSSARRRLYGTVSLSAARQQTSDDRFRPGVLLDEIDDFLHRRAGQEHAFDAHRVQLRDIHVRDDAADDHQHVSRPRAFSRSISFGAIWLWAPDRMDSPMTSASSCSAAAAIISGVWRSPV